MSDTFKTLTMLSAALAGTAAPVIAQQRQVSPYQQKAEALYYTLLLAIEAKNEQIEEAQQRADGRYQNEPRYSTAPRREEREDAPLPKRNSNRSRITWQILDDLLDGKFGTREISREKERQNRNSEREENRRNRADQRRKERQENNDDRRIARTEQRIDQDLSRKLDKIDSEYTRIKRRIDTQILEMVEGGVLSAGQIEAAKRAARARYVQERGAVSQIEMDETLKTLDHLLARANEISENGKFTALVGNRSEGRDSLLQQGKDGDYRVLTTKKDERSEGEKLLALKNERLAEKQPFDDFVHKVMQPKGTGRNRG